MRGEELYTQMVFFVQTILADRYNNRRELWVVPVESPSSVDYGIKKIFSIFAFYRELSRFKILWILDVFQLSCFIHIFTKFLSILTKFLSILSKYVRIVNCSVIDLISKDKVGSLKWSNRVYWLAFMLNFSIFRLFSSKMRPNLLFLAHFL